MTATLSISQGQVWRVGNHTLVCSDLMSSSLYDSVLDGALYRPTLMFTDPPWGQARVIGYRRDAGLLPREDTWHQVYRRIASLAIDRGLPIWMESAKSGTPVGDQTPATLATLTYREADYWAMTYDKDRPAGLYYSFKAPPPLELQHSAILNGMGSKWVPEHILRAYPVGVVIDPCAWRGWTLLAAQKVGWRSIGNEASPARAEVALKRLERATAQKAERVS